MSIITDMDSLINDLEAKLAATQEQLTALGITNDTLIEEQGKLWKDVAQLQAKLALAVKVLEDVVYAYRKDICSHCGCNLPYFASEAEKALAAINASGAERAPNGT